MEYITLIITGLLGLIGTLFKTTKESDNKTAIVKWPNHIGWIILILMISSFLISLYSRYVTIENSKIETRNSQITDSLGRFADSISQVHAFQILRQDSFNSKELIRKSDLLRKVTEQHQQLTQTLSDKQLEMLRLQMEHERNLALSFRNIPINGVLIIRTNVKELKSEVDKNEEQELSQGSSIEYDSYIHKETRNLLFPNFVNLKEFAAGININFGKTWMSRFSFNTNGNITSDNSIMFKSGLGFKRPLGKNTFYRYMDELQFSINFPGDSVNAAILYNIVKTNKLTVNLWSYAYSIYSKKITCENWRKIIKEIYFIIPINTTGNFAIKIPLKLQKINIHEASNKAQLIWIQSGEIIFQNKDI